MARREPTGPRIRVLPPDLVADAGRRLSIASAAMATVFALSFLMHFLVVRESAAASAALQRSILFAGPAFLISVVMLLVARSGSLAPRHLLDLGLAYEIVIAICVSGLENFTPLTEVDLRGTSWVAVIVVLFPVLVPATPVKTLATALVAATTGPLMYALGTMVPGHASLPSSLVSLMFLGNYVAAGLAMAPALVISELGDDVSKAREMGNYRLERLLGEGAMGQVWLGRHRMLARPAAIKLIQPESLGGTHSSQDLLQRFRREAEATAQLRSPNTVTLYDFGVTDDGTFFYAMEMLDGLDLETLVIRFGPLPAERVIHFLIQMCYSLEEAHAYRFVHRDIKPANVYTCRLGTQVDVVKLLDFGLVKSRAAGPGSPTLTAVDTVFGTPAYMAPEQASSHDIDGRADLYSVGCVAYWLLTGQMVFSARSAIEVIAQHMTDVPIAPSLRTLRSIPRDLEAVVMKCLEKDRARRPQSARDLAQELAACATARAWTAETAADWWAANLPELAGTAGPSPSPAP